MSSMSQQTIAIKQARSPSDLVHHLPKIHPESEAMTSVIMETLKRRGPAMTTGVMRICLATLKPAVEALATPASVAWARALVPTGISVLGAAVFGLLGWRARVLWERREKEKEKKREREEEGAGGELPLWQDRAVAPAVRRRTGRSDE